MDAQPATIRAYLVTASSSFEDVIEDKDREYVQKIGRLSYLVDPRGHYLISEFARDCEPDFCAVPLYGHVLGHFTPPTQEWLKARGLEIHHTRA